MIPNGRSHKAPCGGAACARGCEGRPIWPRSSKSYRRPGKPACGQAIEEGLNAQKIPTSRGDGEWTATQVMRILERLDHFVAEVGGSDSLAA